MSVKSSAKSSHSSLRSTTSISSTINSGAKAVKRGVKRIKKHAENIVRPLKRTKHALSNVSTPVLSDAEDDPTSTQDNASIMTNETPTVIEINSDDDSEDMVALKEELGTPSFFILIISCTYFSSQRLHRKLGGPQCIHSSSTT